MNHEELKNCVEAYCLGALDDAEHREFEQHLASGCAECTALVAEMQQVATEIAYSVEPVAPPAAVKERVLAAIRPDTSSEVAAPAPAVAGTNDRLVDILEKALRKWRRIGWGLAGALAITVLAGIIYTQSLHNTNSELASRIAINESLIQELRLEINEQQRVLEVIRAPRIRIVDLSGQPVSPQSSGRVVVSLADSNAVFIARDLPAPPADKDYQLWMLKGSEPVDAGIVSRQPDGSYVYPFRLIPERQNLAAFALTLEQKGGAPAPQGDMYLLGTYSGD